MQLSARIRAASHLASPVFVILLLAAPGGAARAQSLTGTWQVTVSEVSNTCSEPLGPPEMSQLEIRQEGDLIAAESGAPNQTTISGVVSGANVSVAFEVFEEDGLVVYDPAENNLTISAGGAMLSGDLHWTFYEPLECTGTQDWSGVRDVGTPGDLSGDWTLTATELTESCGPIDPMPLPLPVTIQQEGDLVRVVSDLGLGETRIAGWVSGTTLYIGAGLEQNGFMAFDAADNALPIDPSFLAFGGTVSWQSFDAPTCSGVDSFVATLPEPDTALGALAAVASLATLRRRGLPASQPNRLRNRSEPARSRNPRTA